MASMTPKRDSNQPGAHCGLPRPSRAPELIQPTRAPELPRPSRAPASTTKTRSRSPPGAPKKLRRCNAKVWDDFPDMDIEENYPDLSKNISVNPYVDDTMRNFGCSPTSKATPTSSVRVKDTVIKQLNFDDDIIMNGTAPDFMDDLPDIPPLPPRPGSSTYKDAPLSSRLNWAMDEMEKPIFEVPSSSKSSTPSSETLGSVDTPLLLQHLLHETGEEETPVSDHTVNYGGWCCHPWVSIITPSPKRVFFATGFMQSQAKGVIFLVTQSLEKDELLHWSMKQLGIENPWWSHLHRFNLCVCSLHVWLCAIMTLLWV